MKNTRTKGMVSFFVRWGNKFYYSLLDVHCPQRVVWIGISQSLSYSHFTYLLEYSILIYIYHSFCIIENNVINSNK